MDRRYGWNVAKKFSNSSALGFLNRSGGSEGAIYKMSSGIIYDAYFFIQHVSQHVCKYRPLCFKFLRICVYSIHTYILVVLCNKEFTCLEIIFENFYPPHKKKYIRIYSSKFASYVRRKSVLLLFNISSKRSFTHIDKTWIIKPILPPIPQPSKIARSIIHEIRRYFQTSEQVVTTIHLEAIHE